MAVKRREFLAGAGGVFVAAGSFASMDDADVPRAQEGDIHGVRQQRCGGTRSFNGPYRGEHLERVAFPMGVREHRPFLEVAAGEIPCTRIEYTARR